MRILVAQPQPRRRTQFSMRSPDVVIVGAGVIGSAIAYALSRSTRLRVLLIERDTPGCEASGAAAGVLAVASSRARTGVLFDLRRASAAMFPELVSSLQAETGIDLGYRPGKLITLAFSDAETHRLQELVRHRTAQGLRCEMLERRDVLALESAVNPAVQAGALFPDDGAIDSARLVAGLVHASRCRGVEVWPGRTVQSIVSTDGSVALRVEGCDIEAGVVVVAAGAWSGDVMADRRIKIPLRPARGEMAAVRPVGWQLRSTLAAGDMYLVPRNDGEVLIGSTTAFVGYDKQVTAEGLATLRSAGERMVPQAGSAALVRTWAGLRPCSTIRRPIIASLPTAPNVILACGHHRSGILLAPVTAQMVTEMITGAAPTVPLRPFSYRRH